MFPVNLQVLFLKVSAHCGALNMQPEARSLNWTMLKKSSSWYKPVIHYLKPVIATSSNKQLLKLVVYYRSKITHSLSCSKWTSMTWIFQKGYSRYSTLLITTHVTKIKPFLQLGSNATGKFAPQSNKVSMTGYVVSEVWEKHGAQPSAFISHCFWVSSSFLTRVKRDQSRLSVITGFQSRRQANNEEEAMKGTTASGFCCVWERLQLPHKTLGSGQKTEGQRWFRKQQGSGPQRVWSPVLLLF